MACVHGSLDLGLVMTRMSNSAIQIAPRTRTAAVVKLVTVIWTPLLHVALTVLNTPGVAVVRFVTASKKSGSEDPIQSGEVMKMMCHVVLIAQLLMATIMLIIVNFSTFD